MKNYLILTKVMLKNMLSSLNPFTGVYSDGKKKTRAIVRTVLIILASLTAIGSVVYLEYLIYKGLNFVRMPLLLPGMAIFASMGFVLLIGLFQGMSELFQGKDAPFLAVLPLTSRQVFAARLTSLYVSELAIDALICIPAFIFYSIGSGSALPVALTGPVVLLLMPLIPLSIVALVSCLLMRISAFARHRDTVVMVLSMLLALGYSFAVTMFNSSHIEPSNAIQMLLSNDGLLNRVIGIFPPVKWAAQGLLGNTGMLLLFIGVSLACTAGVIALAGPGYLELALSGTEKTVVRRKSSGSFAWKPGTPLRALHVLEWKQLLRTPAWAYNSLFGVIILPIMITVGMISGTSNSDANGIAGLRNLLSGVDQGYVALVTAGVLMFGSMVNPAVATAISREGGCWPFALTLPVRSRTRFIAKLLVGIEINIACSLAIAIAAFFLVGMPLPWLLAAWAVSLLVSVASAALALWVDALRPQLSWSSEMEAIKKNFNQIFGMLLWVLLVALCVVPAILLWDRGGAIALAVVAGTALIEAVVSLLLLMSTTEKRAVLQA